MGKSNDLTVTAPEVSARHCRLRLAPQGFVVEDLGSANGTFVNGRRISGPVPVTPRDRVTLGQKIPLPWPDATLPAVPVVIRVGRLPDNDVVLDYPTVSGHHARITVRGGEARLEDLGSTNGTALNRPENRVRQALLGPGDVVYLGTLRVPAARLLR